MLKGKKQMDYMYLKSGTDVRGVASDLGGKSVELDSAAVYDIASAFVVWCVNKFNKPSNELNIALGHDSRITADLISDSVKKALCKAGVTVLDCGLASTPAMFMTTVDLHTDAAIQITASHHPFDRNGLKFFIGTGGLEGGDISEILTLASQAQECISEQEGIVQSSDYMKDYAARLRDMIIREVGKGEKPLDSYHIVVDAGNGVGGFYANEVLAPLGADISGSQFLDPDGMFPNHIPNPENKQAIESICDAVKKSGADFGVIFDTDVDRAGCVDGDGNEINRNRLIAIASYIALGGKKGGTIVTDSVTSDGLKKYIQEDLGGIHYRYRRGYKNVINKAIELCEQGIDCPLAIETSGHAALKENYFLDDGAYLATKIIIELAKGIDIKALLSTMEMPAEEAEYRFNILEKDFRSYGENVIAKLEEFASLKEGYVIADDNREGIRVSTPNGWFLLRLSVHDPVMPMNFESNEIGGIEIMKQELKDFFIGFGKLEIPKGF